MKRVARSLLSLALMMLAGGLLAATLVRFSPGWEVDEREMSLRRSEESLSELRRQNSIGFGELYFGYLWRLAHGNLGESRSFRKPVSQLLAEHIAPTTRTIGWGLLLAWTTGLLIAIALSWQTFHHPRSHLVTACQALAALTGGLLLSLPAAVIGFAALLAGAAPQWAVAAALYPKVYRHCGALVGRSFTEPHVWAAMARGVPRWRILLVHVLRPIVPQLAALGGMTVSLAFGAALPVEVALDSPGIGWLAWQAALSRDTPVLIAITFLVAFLVKVAALSVDWMQKTEDAVS